MQQKATAYVTDATSAIILGLGIALLLLPVVLHLWLGVDNDAYLVVAEGARADPLILGEIGLEWMFRMDFLLWPAFLLVTGLGLRWLVWRWQPWGLSQGPGDRANPRWAKSL